MYTCRECEHELNQATEICPYCGTDLTQPAAAETEAPKQRTPRQILLRWAVILGVIAASLYGFLWFVMPHQGNDPAARAESQALDALRETRSALSDYAAAQPGGFPRSLEPLGDPVRAAARLAAGGGYELQYTPGPADESGVVHSYVLEARAGNYGYRSFYVDQSGVVRATREDRAATAEDPPVR